jgi:hypothetical protein
VLAGAVEVAASASAARPVVASPAAVAAEPVASCYIRLRRSSPWQVRPAPISKCASLKSSVNIDASPAALRCVTELIDRPLYLSTK